MGRVHELKLLEGESEREPDRPRQSVRDDINMICHGATPKLHGSYDITVLATMKIINWKMLITVPYSEAV